MLKTILTYHTFYPEISQYSGSYNRKYYRIFLMKKGVIVTKKTKKRIIVLQCGTILFSSKS